MSSNGVDSASIRTIRLPGGVYTFDPSKRLGRRGGFGEVFEGHTAAGSVVAVKKLHISAANAAHRELRVAELFRGAASKHIVPFLDSGEDAETGDYFIVMARADHSLQSILDRGEKFSAKEAAHVMHQILCGLTEAGELVHRDLKPDNVLFHEGAWKVADFGIARFVEEATAENTLKSFLSQHYAAPEQFRLQRATHATDLYALGCIGFALINGQPPFVKDPPNEHLTAAVPEFSCDDPRLVTLINMLLRNEPSSRPTSSRVNELLLNLVNSTGAARSPHQGLAGAAAQIAQGQQAQEARAAEASRLKAERSRLAKCGLEILSGNLERLWGEIHRSAPNAERKQGNGDLIFECRLGEGTLSCDLEHRLCEPRALSQSGWDLVVQATIEAKQKRSAFVWSASLIYCKPKDKEDYRWYELSFWTMQGSGSDPHAIRSHQDADYVLSHVMHVENLAFGPTLIDDEMENQFHERWIWLLQHAAIGKLNQPRGLPIREWPPLLL